MLMSNNEEDQLKIQLASVDQRLRTIVAGEYITLVPLTTDHALPHQVIVGHLVVWNELTSRLDIT